MLVFQSAPSFYSQFNSPSRQIESPRDKYLRALSEAQAAKDNYLQFLAAEEEKELDHQRQAYQRRAHELQFLSRAQAGFPTTEYSDFSPRGCRNVPGRAHFSRHPQFHGWGRGSIRAPGNEYTFTPHQHPEATHQRLPSQTENNLRLPCRTDSSDISQVEELLSYLLGGQVTQSREEPKVIDQKLSTDRYSPCRARPLNPHCPRNISGIQPQPSSRPTTLDHGNSAQIPQRCQYRRLRLGDCGVLPKNVGPEPGPLSDQRDSKKVSPLPSSSAPSVESIKDELERRLYTNPDTEIRDTVHALLASLSGSSQVKPSEPAPLQGEDTKGKAKAVSFSDSITDPATVDITASLNALRDVEASFNALESEFVFPAHLDFDTTPASPTPSVHSDSSSASSVLTYTSTNAPVRYYEHALSSLLSRLDAVDSFGSEEVRARRKELVARVESTIEEIEREVNGRLEAQKRKEAVAMSERMQASNDSLLPETLQYEVPQELLQAHSEVSSVATPHAEGVLDTSVEHADDPSLITLEEPLSNPLTTLSPASLAQDLSLPNRKRSDSDTLSNQLLTESVSSDIPAIDETESLADSTDSTSTIQPPAEKRNEEQSSPCHSVESSPEQLGTFLLPAPSPESPAPSQSANTSTSDDELVLVDSVSDGGWSEVAPDA